MATCTALDGRPSSRFVRNLALSLSGGALLTLLGAGVSGAQDGGSAGTASDGRGDAHSGDATAVGNRSGTQKNQTATPSGTVGNLQVVDQTAAVGNVGVAVANTGANRAVGNQSDNTARAEQIALNALGGATSSGTVANASNGTARISTGDASAIGNQSNTTINQSANGSAHGGIGSILVVTQTGAVLNAGVAVADTGQNDAEGNTSNNELGLVQTANATAGLASNSGKSHNTSDGLATIHTGNASSVGNQSDTKVTQSTQGSAGGDGPGGLQLLNQLGVVVNAGAATASTGSNEADGNESETFESGVEQHIGTDGPPPDGPFGVASNTADVSTFSDGTGEVWTGPARAVGNQSTTELSQTSDSYVHGLGASIVPQTAVVLNVGLAQAESGDNEADGNDSESSAIVLQDIPDSAGTDIGVAANFAQAESASGGSATIRTGAAVAGGNVSRTNLSQNVKSDGDEVDLQPQLGVVANLGVGQAISGENDADGNESFNEAFFDNQHAVLSEDPGIDLGVVGQVGKASNASDGNAAVHTGDAVAQGNDSETDLSQEIDPSGLVLNPQVGIVANVGVAVASTGDNFANGNTSSNSAGVAQEVEVGANNDTTQILAGTIVASNNGEASAASDGSAAIVTGSADASGNVSRTNLGQTANGSIDGAGLILNTQVGVVANVGVGIATSGNNRATGNESENEAAVFAQDAWIASENDTNDVFLAAPIVVGSNQAEASAASDGSATIHTGRASATGSRSETDLSQGADGRIEGLGVVLNTQVGVVANVGIARANTGDNDAIGNTSANRAGTNQQASVASDNLGFGDDATSLTAFGPVTAANSADVDVASDGDATVRTGAAMAVGNASTTELGQDATGHAPGLVVDTQIGVIANVGLADANTGQNFATGNDSGEGCSGGGDGGGDGSCATSVSQTAWLLSGNRNFDGQGPDLEWEMFVVGPATAANSVSAFDPSDGSATIRTGDAHAQGNVSTTLVAQETDSDVPGLGGVLGTQAAVVANVGIAGANTGDNIADGNVSANDADLDQIAAVGSGNQDSVDFAVVGPATTSNSAEVGNTSDGTATVGTGSALATGNTSTTTLVQRQTGVVEGLGLTVGTQVGAVANVGVGIANTGDNTATGNESEGSFEDVDGGLTAPDQSALLNSFADDPAETTILGPATASNSASVTNTSDGDACICTGNAVASGNVSSTTLLQDLDLTATSGFIVLTEAGAVLNAGVGLANTGVNTAVGNSSENTGLATQVSEINDALLEPVDGPQTSSNTLNLANTSDGSGHVGSGNASGTGNQSTTDFVQAAEVESSFAVSALVGATANAGLGLANTGRNDATGNDSTNTVVVDQEADGSGVVANQGEGTNDSDGTAIIGDPQCCDAEDVPSDEGKPGLPRTGAELEAQAAMALMLLLVGFGLQRRSRTYAFRD